MRPKLKANAFNLGLIFNNLSILHHPVFQLTGRKQFGDHENIFKALVNEKWCILVVVVFKTEFVSLRICLATYARICTRNSLLKKCYATG